MRRTAWGLKGIWGPGVHRGKGNSMISSNQSNSVFHESPAVPGWGSGSSQWGGRAVSCHAGSAGGGSVDLLLLPRGGGDGAVGVDDEFGAAHHHGQEEEAREHHEGDGEALVHIDGHAGSTQARSPGHIPAGQRGRRDRSSTHRTKRPTVPSGIPPSFPSLHSLPAFQENPGENTPLRAVCSRTAQVAVRHSRTWLSPHRIRESENISRWEGPGRITESSRCGSG